MEYPIHARKTGIMDITKAREYMKPEVRKRFDAVMSGIYKPPVPYVNSNNSNDPSLSSKDIDNLKETGIIEHESLN